MPTIGITMRSQNHNPTESPGRQKRQMRKTRKGAAIPISHARAYTLSARQRDTVPELEPADEDGLRRPGGARERARTRISRAVYGDNVQKPTAEELDEARAHAAHTRTLEQDLDHPA